MARRASEPRCFAGSLLLSAALHALLLAMLAFGAPIVRGDQRLYVVEIEPEPPRAASANSIVEPPAREPEEGTVSDGRQAAASSPAPGRIPDGLPTGFRAGPKTPVGQGAVPPAAQAGSVLTADGEAGSVDFAVVQGNAASYAGGVTSATGTSETAVRDPRATGAGMAPKHAGLPQPAALVQSARPRVTPVPVVSQSRAARPETKSWACAFPAQADVDQVHYARVTIVVSVGEDGGAKSVVVLSDPGHGFAAAARACALRQRYSVARDASGRVTAGTTAPFFVTFTR